MSPVFALLAGLLLGVLSGFGVGGGTLLLLFMVYGAGLSQHTAQGINLLYFLPTAAAALVSHFRSRLISARTVLPAMAAGMAAAAGASLLAAAMNTELLRRLWGLFLMAVGLMELFRREKNG